MRGPTPSSSFARVLSRLAALVVGALALTQAVTARASERLVFQTQPMSNHPGYSLGKVRVVVAEEDEKGNVDARNPRLSSRYDGRTLTLRLKKHAARNTRKPLEMGDSRLVGAGVSENTVSTTIRGGAAEFGGLEIQGVERDEDRWQERFLFEAAVEGKDAPAPATSDSLFIHDIYRLPPDKSTHGHRIDWLYNFILAITGVVFIATEGLLALFLIAFRGRPGRKALYVHGNHRLELAWSIAPAAVLIFIAIAQTGTWADLKMDDRLKDPRWDEATDVGVRVRVLAKRFSWYFRYPGKDGKFFEEQWSPDGKTLLNDWESSDDIVSERLLAVPEGKKVVLEISSADVLHALFLPNFRLKQDAVPGLVVPQWFQPVEGSTGIYEITCAELCGWGHTTMAATVQVMPPAQFQAWLEEQREKTELAGPPASRADVKSWSNWPLFAGALPIPGWMEQHERQTEKEAAHRKFLEAQRRAKREEEERKRAEAEAGAGR